MIINIPTADSLNEVALRQYFSAWSSLIDIQSDFRATFFGDADPKSVGNEWNEEWAEYLSACQPELQSICALIQQSNELALKAKICEVSPYLLLIRNDTKFRTKHKDVEFSEFKTLDAVELPSAVNSFCQNPLSAKMIGSYHEIRSLRNKIAHLGYLEKKFSPDELLHKLVFQYTEIWNGRSWLKDRVEFQHHTRLAFLQDGRNGSPQADVMYELRKTLVVFTNAEFLRLFGRRKSDRRYLCHVCMDDAKTKWGWPKIDDCKTAFLDKVSKSLHCIMCGGDFKITRTACKMANCKSTVIGDNNDSHVGKCHVCNDEQDFSA